MFSKIRSTKIVIWKILLIRGHLIRHAEDAVVADERFSHSLLADLKQYI